MMRADQLARGLQVRSVVDPTQRNRQVAGNAVRPKRRRPEIVAFQDFRRRPKCRVRVENAIRNTLEEVRFVRRYSDMMKLNLSLGPGQGGRAFERRNIVVLIGQADNLLT